MRGFGGYLCLPVGIYAIEPEQALRAFIVAYSRHSVIRSDSACGHSFVRMPRFRAPLGKAEDAFFKSGDSSAFFLPPEKLSQ